MSQIVCQAHDYGWIKIGVEVDSGWTMTKSTNTVILFYSVPYLLSGFINSKELKNSAFPLVKILLDLTKLVTFDLATTV